MNTMLFVPGLESSKSEVDFGSVNRAGGWEKKNKRKSSSSIGCIDMIRS